MVEPATKMEAALELLREQGTLRLLVTWQARHSARLPGPPVSTRAGGPGRSGALRLAGRRVERAPWFRRGRAPHPRGVVCLLSASFHGLTTQSPHDVWLTLPSKAWAPKVEYPKLRIIRASGLASPRWSRNTGSRGSL